jgi:protein phosphatase
MNTISLEKKKTLLATSAAVTDRGNRRKLNEDAIFHHSEQTEMGKSIGLYLVCDGLGGHQAGEVASHLAIETIVSELSTTFPMLKLSMDGEYTRFSRQTIDNCIHSAIHQANNTIRSYAETYPIKAGNMGTTLTLALVYNEKAYIANIGDSRTYIWQEGTLHQVTQDHSMAVMLAEMGLIKRDEIMTHPRRHTLCKALGTYEEVTADLFEWDLQAGDRLLLCSDGLWQSFAGKQDLAQWFESATTPESLCRQLVAEASKRDGSDNISAVAVDLEELYLWNIQDLEQEAPAITQEMVIA